MASASLITWETVDTIEISWLAGPKLPVLIGVVNGAHDGDPVASNV